MRRRPVGKISLEDLKKFVFPYTGVQDSSVLLGPRVGEDTALIDLGASVLILKADPVTGAVEQAGWLSVHVNANDGDCIRCLECTKWKCKTVRFKAMWGEEETAPEQEQLDPAIIRALEELKEKECRDHDHKH